MVYMDRSKEKNAFSDGSGFHEENREMGQRVRIFMSVQIPVVYVIQDREEEPQVQCPA